MKRRQTHTLTKKELAEAFILQFFVIKWKGCWKMHSDEEIFKETTPKALLQLLKKITPFMIIVIKKLFLEVKKLK